MTKFILLALLVSLPSFAQTDELTLESTTAPTIIEDGTDLSQAPAEEPVEAPDTVDVTENTETVDTQESLLDETPATEMADSAPAEATTPNPIAEDKRPEEQPEKIAEEDRAPSPEVSTPVITTEAPKDDRYINHRASHWVSTFAFEGMRYELPFDFEGVEKNVRERNENLYGGRLGLGGQLHLGKGFFTTSMVEGFYLGTLFTKSQEAGPQVEGEEAGSPADFLAWRSPNLWVISSNSAPKIPSWMSGHI
jgi:hypothetical protein